MKHLKTFFLITAPMWIVFLMNQIFFTFFLDFFIENWPWVDVPLHIIGGLSASWTAYLFLKYLAVEFKPTWLKFAVLIGFACFAAIIWEVYEFYHDMIFKEFIYQAGALDMVADLGDGLIGSILFCVGLWWRKK